MTKNTQATKALEKTLSHLIEEELDGLNHAWTNLTCPLCIKYAGRTSICNNCPLTQFRDLKYDYKGCTGLSILLFGNLEYDPSILASVVKGLIIGYETGELE